MGTIASPACPYCHGATAFLDSSAMLYRGRDYGPVYACLPCDAWVGCHPGTTNPLGRLANKELRQAKIAAHAAFDPLWTAKQQSDGVTKGRARGKGYAWLAGQLGIEAKDCHIGLFDAEQCRRVVEICEPYRGKSK